MVLEELSCEVFQLAVLPACPMAFLAKFRPNQHVVALCLELASQSSWCTILCPSRRDVHLIPWSCQAICHSQSRVCSTLPDFTSNPPTWRHGLPEQNCLRELHHLSLVRFPETIFPRCLFVAFHVIPGNYPACLTNHGHTSMASVTSIERRVSNSSLKHRV